ncbi:uncharacterized protein LOC128547992 [Mercenaria mercenaria]|uniref:uncharacterized protein LOC128547992 n=1 Tax=Mercenaria mercenaria TaxID=6596 RepID=UPI00234EB0AD|nr:uncharacterized protein LOC128547992 [Mercenaria mercenaria]
MDVTDFVLFHTDPLRKPVDLKCWDYDFNEMMCNWSLAVEYHNPGDINTTCEYYNASNDETSVQSTTGSFWEQCPNMVNTSCRWDPLSYPAPISTIDVRVTVRNTRRNVSEVIYQTFNKFDIVEPGPVTELKGYWKPLQNRCVELQWKPSSPTRSYVFIVTYR